MKEIYSWAPWFRELAKEMRKAHDEALLPVERARPTLEERHFAWNAFKRVDIWEPLKMPSVVFLETKMKKCDFSFPSFSVTDVTKNGSTSLCCTTTSNF